MKKIICLTILFASAVFANQNPTSLTIYNQNFAIVQQQRTLELTRGTNDITIEDIAKTILPQSVIFSSDDMVLLEQSYRFDIESENQLLRKSLNEPIEIRVVGSGSDPGINKKGTLLSFSGNYLIINNDKAQIETITRNRIETIITEPEGIITTPSLFWTVYTDSNDIAAFDISYMAQNINWQADYNAILVNDSNTLDLSAWVTVNNNTGITYTDAELKLLAGDVPMDDVRPVARRNMEMMAMDSLAAGTPNGFEQRQLDEYHIYTLPRPATIEDQQSLQLKFMETAENISFERLYIYERSQNPERVQVKIEFENTEENNLGIPLPAGTVRMYLADKTKAPELLGQTRIDHTAEGEELKLHLANAFDIVPEYTLLESSRPERNTQRQTHRIEIRNRKDQAVTVHIDEKFPTRRNWTIDRATHDYEQTDANTVRFTLEIAPNQSETIEYTETQTWL